MTLPRLPHFEALVNKDHIEKHIIGCEPCATEVEEAFKLIDERPMRVTIGLHSEQELRAFNLLNGVEEHSQEWKKPVVEED